MLAILLGAIKPRLLARSRRIRNQLGQRDRTGSDEIVTADLVPVEQGELDRERIFELPDVEEHFFVPCGVEPKQRR